MTKDILMVSHHFSLAGIGIELFVSYKPQGLANHP